MYIALFFTAVAALSEGFGIIMLLPLLSNLGQPEMQDVATDEAELDGFSSIANDFLLVLGYGGSTEMVLITIAIAFLLKGVITFLGLSYNAHLRGQLLTKLKSVLFKSYSHMDYEYYAGRDTGYFVNLVNEQANRSLQSFFYLTQVSAQAINAFVYLTFAFFIAWRFGLMALAVGIILMLLFQWLNSFVRDLSRSLAHENGVLSKLLIQAMQSFKYLNATSQIEPIGKQINLSIDRLANYEFQTHAAAGFTLAAREPIAVALIVAILAVQLFYFEQPLAPILVSVLLFYRAMNSMLGVQGYLQGALEYIGSIELINEELIRQQENREKSGNQQIDKLSEKIELKGISFGYNNNSKIISDLDLVIAVRSTMAIIGPSGAGKSTIADLLTLSLRPSSGTLSIDGIDSREIALSSWRNQIGYVSQETVVFDETIANNICLWAGDYRSDEVLLQAIEEAADKANLSEFIKSLPQGYDTEIGERGLRLSGGQRQRLFIARELFRKPLLLILDEATSALDTLSELEIQKSIDRLHGEVTVVIIAHRLATIKNVDTVCVIEEGKMVEHGCFDELKNKENSRLRYLLDLQSL